MKKQSILVLVMLFFASVASWAQSDKTVTVRMGVASKDSAFVAGFIAQEAGIAKKYGLPERFVILPSQLWEHKNHLQLLDAMAVLEARRVDLVAVFCGAPYDPRSPRYVSRLLQAASALGVRHRVVLLGELERAELVALMRQSVGFVQPALHEGGGLPAEEARLLGKRIVLADLPLQREAAVPGTSFFAPDDAGSLADAVEEAFAGAAPGVDVEAEDRAIAAAGKQAAAAGAAFVRLVAEAADRRGPGRRGGAAP